MKICIKCKIDKELNEFHKHKSSKDGYETKCKQCRKFYQDKYNKKYYKENKEEIDKHSKEYYGNNKEKINNRSKIQSKKYYKENKVERLKHMKEYNASHHVKERKKTQIQKKREQESKLYHSKYKFDIYFKLKKSLRIRLNQLLKKNNIHKTLSALKLIGCTVEEYKQHIEKQWLPELTWNNYGTVWEIDHIIPCVEFDLNDLKQQEKCFHYTNLRPLFKTTEIAMQFGYNNIEGNRNRNKIY